MTESNMNDDAEDVDDMGEAEGGVTGAETITPQGEVSGDDPAGLEMSGVGDEGDEGDDSEPAGGVGDWDPSSQGGGGGEVY